MDHSVLAITQLFKIVNKKILLLNILVISSSFIYSDVYSQKKSKEVSVENLSDEAKEKLNSYFFDGIRQKNIDNYEAAIRNFNSVISIDAKNDAAYFELGGLYAKQKDFHKSKENYAKAAELKPTNDWYLESYAKSCERLSQFTNAEEIYKQLIESNPDKIENYFDLASVKLYQDDFKSAIKIYNQIEKRIGINEDLINQKQKIWLRLGKVDKAAEEANRLIENDPTEIRYRINLAEIYLANKELESAKKTLDEILALQPNNAFAQLALADYYREKKDDANSYKYLKAAFANPEIDIDQKVRILASYFQLLGNKEMKDRAFELSKLVTIAHPTEAKAFAIYGDFLYQDKQNLAAKEAYQKTISLDKKVFAVWQNLMLIEIDLLDYKSLLETSNEAVQLFPAQQIVHYLNAIAKSQNKDFESAIDAYKNALNLGVDNSEIEAQIYSGIGDAYHSLKKHVESDAAFDKSLKIKSDDPYVLNNYAYYLSLRNERLDKALEMSLKSNNILKNNSSFLDTYAWILFQLKRYTEALEWIEKAMDAGGSSSATIIEHKGDVLFKLGRTNDAVKEWMQAAQKSEASELLKKKISTKQYHE